MANETKTDLIVIKEFFGMDNAAAIRELKIQSEQNANNPALLTADERKALADGIRDGSLTY